MSTNDGELSTAAQQSILCAVTQDTIKRLWRAREIIDEEFGTRLSLGGISQYAAYSPYHFQRLYRGAFGESPQEHLARKRFERARYLLLHTAMPITEIVYLVGYESPATFANAFRERTGYSPRIYRVEMRRRTYYVDIGHLFIPACFLATYAASAQMSA